MGRFSSRQPPTIRLPKKGLVWSSTTSPSNPPGRLQVFSGLNPHSNVPALMVNFLLAGLGTERRLSDHQDKNSAGQYANPHNKYAFHGSPLS
jgi:hypothetical protein